MYEIIKTEQHKNSGNSIDSFNSGSNQKHEYKPEQYNAW